MLSEKAPPTSLWDLLGDMLHPTLELLTSKRDLHSLSLVSKDSRATTEPFLYSSIEWSWKGPQAVWPASIYYLLRTLLRRPELGQYVRRLAIFGDQEPLVPRKHIASLDMDDVAIAIVATKYRYPYRWIIAVKDDNLDAILSLILLRLPNLQSLVLDMSTTHGNRYLGFVFNSGIITKDEHSLATFKSLRTVKFRVRKVYTTWDRKILAHLLYLPELKDLTYRMNAMWPPHWPEYDNPPTAVMLTSLDLELIGIRELRHVLSVTPSLKTLRSSYRTPVRYAWLALRFDELGEALGQVRTTLTSLIVASGDKNCKRQHELPDGSLKVLASFDQLTELDIPLQFLTASFSPEDALQLQDVVPKHVRDLTISDQLELEEQNEWTDIMLYELLARWLQNGGLDVRRITLFLENTDVEWGPGMRKKFVELCQASGVEGRVIKLLPDNIIMNEDLDPTYRTILES